MDLNDLFSRHQISLMRAARAASTESRHIHHDLASHYARQIGRMQQSSGATFAMARI